MNRYTPQRAVEAMAAQARERGDLAAAAGWSNALYELIRATEPQAPPPPALEVRDTAIAVHGRWVNVDQRMARAARLAATVTSSGTASWRDTGFETAGAARMALSRFSGWLRDTAESFDLADEVARIRIDKHGIAAPRR